MSVYERENPQFLRESLNSLTHSSQVPDEVVLVEDGFIGEPLRNVITEFREHLRIVSVPLPFNVGLPSALNAGLVKCSYEVVARFDTDDLCGESRFERQLAFLAAHPDVAAVSCAVQEFDIDSGVLLGFRAPPCGHVELMAFARYSSPLNHPAAMYRKSAVLSVGGYPVNMKVAFEDYALWVRMMIAGYRLANLPEVLVHMRAGAAQAARRTGFRYAKQEIEFAGVMRSEGFFNTWQYIRFLALRVPIRLLPKRIVILIYQLCVRKRSVL